VGEETRGGGGQEEGRKRKTNGRGERKGKGKGHGGNVVPNLTTVLAPLLYNKIMEQVPIRIIRFPVASLSLIACSIMACEYRKRF
jgi:hypothetical protein